MASNSKKKPAQTVKPPAETPKKIALAQENPPSEVKIEGGNEAFREEVLKSREMIENSDKPGETLPKNKGGRPSNAEKARREAEARAAQAAEIQNVVPSEGLKPLLQLPFAAAAIQTGFPGFQLTDQEADSLVPSAHAVLATYAPQVKSEHVALVALGGGLISLAFTKYMAFIAFRSQGAAPVPEVPPPPSEPAPASAFASPVDGFLTQKV